MKRLNKKNPTLIQVSSKGSVIGSMTCKEFRNWAGDTNTFIATLCERFNAHKEQIGETERVKQVLNAA